MLRNSSTPALRTKLLKQVRPQNSAAICLGSAPRSRHAGSSRKSALEKHRCKSWRLPMSLPDYQRQPIAASNNCYQADIVRLYLQPFYVSTFVSRSKQELIGEHENLGIDSIEESGRRKIRRTALTILSSYFIDAFFVHRTCFARLSAQRKPRPRLVRQRDTHQCPRQTTRTFLLPHYCTLIRLVTRN